MTLSEAVRSLKTRKCTMHEHAAAAAFVHSYYTTEGRHLLRPFTPRAVAVNDSAPRPVTRPSSPTKPMRLTTDQRIAAREIVTIIRGQPQTRDAMIADAVARDARRSRRMLAEINRRNREFWRRP
jgi:hypothetical protein